jgi:conjugal transfer pilus assembly protein TraW
VSLAIEAELKAHDQETKDYGIVGHTYPIIEQDIIEYIKNRLGQIDLNVLETETKVRVQEKIKRPTPVYGITKAKENHEYDYDPTFTLEENIEDHKGNIIYPKGTTINPLSSARMKEALIFIDGDDKAQAEYAIEKYKERGGKVKIILIKGSPIDLGLKHKDEIQFYFDQEGVLTNKLGIKHVPAIVNQDGLKLRIKEVLLK